MNTVCVAWVLPISREGQETEYMISPSCSGALIHPHSDIYELF